MSIFVCSIFLCLVRFCVAAKGPSTPHPTYETRYDYLDIDKILANDRILKRMMDCIMDRGPCTREGKDLKGIIPDALKTNCSKCNDRQKMNVGRALAFLLHYKPEYWFELLNRFDRDGSYRKKLNIESDDGGDILRGSRKGRRVPSRAARRERFKNISA